MSKRKVGSSDEIEALGRKIEKYKKMFDDAVASFSKQDVDEHAESNKESNSESDVANSDSENDGYLMNVSPSSSKTSSREVVTPKLSEKACELLEVQKRKQKEQSFELHPELADCWKEIVMEGLDSKIKKGTEERYPNKGNCPLRAPVLNPEMLPILHKTANRRDRYLSASQDSCGRGLVALGKAISAIFNDEEEPLDKDELLEWFCDGSKMFRDVMHQLTKTRKFHMYQHVDDKRKTVLQDAKADEFLFGENLAKRIKAVSAGEKAGLSLKTVAEKKFGAKPRQLNWKSSSAARGGHSQSSFNTKQFQRTSRPNSGHHASSQPYRTQNRQGQSNNQSDK